MARGQASVAPAAITGVAQGASSNKLTARVTRPDVPLHHAQIYGGHREVEVVEGRGWTLVDKDLSGMKLS